MHQLSKNRLISSLRNPSLTVVGAEASFAPTTDELSPPQPRVEIGKNPATRGILLPVSETARVTNALRACSGLGRCSGSVMEFLVVAPDRQPVTVMTIGGDTCSLRSQVLLRLFLSYSSLIDGKARCFAFSHCLFCRLEEALIENLTKTTYPSGKVVDYVYDNNDRLTNLKVNAVTLSNYTYDLLDRRATRDLVGTATQRSTYTFDNANQLTNLLNVRVGGATISQYGYTYDNVGNRLTMTAPNGTHTYTYNNIEELTTVTGAQTRSFAYDKVANRTTVDGIAYTKNNLNQYTQVGAALYSYDNNGNLTTDGVNTYTYDEENRLATFSKAGTTASYTYDAFNRRVSKTVNGVTTYFVYDGDEDIEERASTGTLSADYVYGDNLDEVLTMKRGATTYYYQYDGLGSVTRLTNAAGATVESYNYDVYGQPSITSTVGNPFFFTGRRLDSESGVYYYRARMYDPKIGRFLQRDPIGYWDSMNLFEYAFNAPNNFKDPYGLWGEWVLVGNPEFWWLIPVVWGLPYILPHGNGGWSLPSLPNIPWSWPWSNPFAPSQGKDSNICKIGDKGGNAEENREKSRNKGIPDSEIGPSGKPKIHNPSFPKGKAAEEAARKAGKGKPIHHPNPVKGKPHFHPTDEQGNKIPGRHYEYPWGKR